MLKIFFWSSIATLLYTYIGYYIVLRIVASFVHKEKKTACDYYPPVSIIVAAYNEEKVISARLENLLEMEYPREKTEIIVASDGSSDRTVEIAKKYEGRGVNVLDFTENRGKATTHNKSIIEARHNIVILTDADTQFEKDFIKKIVIHFLDDKVGCVTGRLIYRSRGGSLSEAESLYWKWELKLIELEDRIGILANASGACMAIRKELFAPLTPIDDCDTATTIDIVLKGKRVVFAKDAIAYDIPPHSAMTELKTKIRGVSKTLMSLARRTSIKGWCANPLLIWTILSHRIFRYFSPYLMLIVLLSNIFLLEQGGFFGIIFFIQISFYLLAMAGFFGNLSKRRVPIASNIFGFTVAMFGMLIGVAVAIIGRAPTTHKTTD